MGPIVLAIDDDRSSQILLRAHLEDEQFCSDFIGISNGKDALSYIQRAITGDTSDVLPNIILLDINMPEMTGWEFLEKFSLLMHQMAAVPSIILLSATNTAEDLKLAENHASVLDITTKPLSNDYLNRLKERAELQHFFANTTEKIAS